MAASEEETEANPSMVRDLSDGGTLDNRNLDRIEANKFILRDGVLPVFAIIYVIRYWANNCHSIASFFATLTELSQHIWEEEKKEKALKKEQTWHIEKCRKRYDAKPILSS